jgi:DNA-binding LacI/PurR family transcriptional regulator
MSVSHVPLREGRRPTLGDVAERAGVSRSTASLVIRQAPGPGAESRERVLRAAAELDYRPDLAAQALRRQRSRLLGVLFTARDPFHADLMESIYPTAEALRYDVVLSAVAATRDEAKAVEALIASRCEALILLTPTADVTHLAALARRLPVVSVNPRVTGAPVDNVRSADGDGARQAVDHLVGLGHRDIVHVDGGRRPGAADRRRGYRSAMRRHGLDAEVRVVTGDETEVSGARAVEALLDADDLPTAVFAFNDRCAIGVLESLRRHGIDVPGRVSVVGYDDSLPARWAHIDLTTVRQDAGRMAELAVRAAAEQLDDGRRDPQDIRLQPELVARGTTGPAPQAGAAPRPLP